MVAYNHREYICQAIDSILEQETTYTYEIIVNDDASSDGTAELIAQKYGDRVTLIARKENVGLTRSIYEMFLRAEGRYIYLCAGDDWVSSRQMIQKHVDFLEANPEYSGVSNWMVQVGKDGEFQMNIENPVVDYTLEDLLLMNNCNGSDKGTFRNYFRETPEELSFLYKCGRNNDETPLWTILLERGPHRVLHEYLTTYRYVKKDGASNYNSTHSCFDMFVDQYSAVEMIKREHPVHNYDGMQYVWFYRYFYPIVRQHDLGKLVSYLGFWKFAKMAVLVPFIHLSNRELPGFMKKKFRSSGAE
jgi:glycosyltransferase involved in cell wall biosynthesis